jgi:hypothetical protein
LFIDNKKNTITKLSKQLIPLCWWSNNCNLSILYISFYLGLEIKQYTKDCKNSIG